MRSHRVRRAALALVAAGLLMLIAIAATLSLALAVAGKGVLMGGIQPCDALGVSPLRYAAGTVVVDQGSAPVLTSTDVVVVRRVVAEERVGDNQMYVFLLDQGSYNVRASYRNGGPESWFSVDIRAGAITQVDIPDRCI